MQRSHTAGTISHICESPKRRKVGLVKKHIPGVPFSLLGQERFGLSRLEAILSTPHSDYSPMHRTLSIQERRASLTRVRTNKALAATSPAARRCRIHCLSRLRDRRLSEAKLNRSVLIQTNHQTKLQKIQRKSERFELHTRGAELPPVVRSWSITLVSVASTGLLWRNMRQRQHLRIESARLLEWLRQISKCVGKLRLLREKVKRKRALALLKGLVPAIRRWLRARRLILRHLVVSALSKGLSKALLQLLMRRCLGAVRVI